MTDRNMDEELLVGAWIAQEELHHRKTHPRLRDDLPKPHPWHCLHSLRVGFRQLVQMESHLFPSFLTVHINFGEGDPANLVNFRNFLDLEVAYCLSSKTSFYKMECFN